MPAITPRLRKASIPEMQSQVLIVTTARRLNDLGFRPLTFSLHLWPHSGDPRQMRG